MEKELETAIGSENYDKYGFNERCRMSRQRVQDFVGRGLTSQGEAQYRRSM